MPEHKSLLTHESRDAAYRLLNDIQSAETARELLIYVRNFHTDAIEFRNIMNLIESAITGKIEQFAQEVEAVANRPRIVPGSDKKGGDKRG